MKFTFKGISLETGDLVEFNSPLLPNTQPIMCGAAVQVLHNKIEIYNYKLASQIGHPQKPHLFREEDIYDIKLIQKSEEAIEDQTGGKFVKGETVSSKFYKDLLTGLPVTGMVIAAFGRYVIVFASTKLLHREHIDGWEAI